MGETLAETRVEVDAQRAGLIRTGEELREAIDLRKRFRENPALVVGIGAGAVFLALGGPLRVARLVRRRFMRSQPERAYDSLPSPLQRFVDDVAGTVGPRAQEARQSLSRELLLWRHDPRKHGKVSKQLAQDIAEGPPGPGRAGWRAFEAAAAIITAALARRAVQRFLSADAPAGLPAADAAATLGGADQPAGTDDYSGMSARARAGRHVD